MTTCFPSNAPIQCGKFQCSANLLCTSSQFSLDGVKNSFCMLHHIILHVSGIIFDIVAAPTLKAKDNDLKESPVAKYLKIVGELLI